MCVQTFENLDFATVYHALSRFKCLNFEKSTFLKLLCHSTTCRVCFWKMTPPDFLSTYIVNLVIFHGFEAFLYFLKKSGQSDQMTVPARRASKFSSQWRAIKLQIICPKSEFKSNSWILRTLVWMSTWRIEKWRRRRRRRASKCRAPQPPASNHAQGPNIPFRGNLSLWYRA